MTADEYATLELQLGAKLVKVDGIWWRRVRPFFFRPLFCYETINSTPPTGSFSWPVVLQYAVQSTEKANSSLNYLILENLEGYHKSQLGRRRCQLLNQAAATFVVRPITEPGELKRGGYEAYISFYERTRYGYLKERRKRPAFERWVETIYNFGNPLVLGGYAGKKLNGVSVSYRVGDTVIYATLFIETDALKRNLGELMFHELRWRAAQEPGIRQVFLRPYQGGNSQDMYYLHRGAKLVRQPARLHVHPVLLVALKWLLPRRHAALVGNW